jgi:4a-hydroxytetrahydrobiopterin dehydratase
VESPSFPEAVELVRKVAEAAEAANHHPDIDIRWRKVTYTLSTHSAGGLTQLDLDLAAQIDSLAG